MVAALLCLAIVPLATGTVRGLDVTQSFVVFSALLAVFVVAVLAVYDVSPWTALFCATAGYTLQNISSGLSLLVQMLVTGRTSAQLPDVPDALVSLGVPIAVYVVGYLLFIRRVNMKGLMEVQNSLMLLMFAIVVITVIGLDLIIKGLSIVGAPFRYLVLLRLIHPLVCVFVLFAEYELLYAKRADEERAETERLLAERERQYRLSRENIEAINIKCHDIRHQIRHLADSGVVVDGSALADIAREVNVYDSVVETGNEALDTILTEKSLTCSGEGIVLTVMAEGSALDFMAPADIYSLFGNALDNAIEAVRAVEGAERRAITVSVQRRRRMVAVSVENCCASTPRFATDGLPLTTKHDSTNHGFGMRSMRAIAERYGGSLHAGFEGGVFYLNVLLAMPEA
ncbi:ATP-binding protein [Olsenella profusa]|uniref:Sensor histidine kinase n=1 Tax=Olsenella profusa TaxID=138595 RepID=A0ABS2F180_9ACTN|nr:sensor histidine kinase [Olsenella profusa]